MGERICNVSDCDKRSHRRGLCFTHYARWRRSGSTDAPRRPSVDQRFWSKVDASGDCWEWTASHEQYGYGQFWVAEEKRLKQAHRVAWELLVGPISEGLELDHLCRNPPCVNPDHLEPVTPEENRRRSKSLTIINARKTRCPEGHEYTAANTYISRERGRAAQRHCRTCKLVRVRARRARQAARNTKEPA